ncbi:hypothetical protein M0805_004722 [Coniferiporia weirii]|nr:hypothetical protein M0805_004722 [Coniferiporia weirii]
MFWGYVLGLVGLVFLVEGGLAYPVRDVRDASAASPVAPQNGMQFMKHYSEFQISDGVGGTAEEEAIAVFVEPFETVDLATIPYGLYDMLMVAKEAVEDAEAELFEPALAKAEAEDDKSLAQALEVGKLKNRVLYATATVQGLKIKAALDKAMGVEDPYEELDRVYAEDYLQWTIDADKKNAGKASANALNVNGESNVK